MRLSLRAKCSRVRGCVRKEVRWHLLEADLHSIWIEEKQLAEALARNEAFWDGQLEEFPLMWITVPGAKPGPVVSQAGERRGAVDRR